MTEITRDAAKAMIESDQRLIVVEVLNESHFRKFHLPGAINVPLDDAFDLKIQVAISDKTQTVIVYCQDLQCPASPKAAKRMEDLGYTRVYDYAAGKADWEAAGLPTETG